MNGEWQHRMRLPRCGPIELAEEAILFRIWAPLVSNMELVLYEGEQPRIVAMQREERCYYSHREGQVPEGLRYAFRLNGSHEFADPCSRWQPNGPHQPSAVARASRFRWTDSTWRGVRRQDLVIYELHVGTFTPEGTFAAVIPRLPALKELGITAIELMPIGQFPGSRNWGYDGVLIYAAQNTYGGPAGLVQLVDACHAHGIAVLLDVVYNHCGPEGNYLSRFGPYFSDCYSTPWGSAVNFDGGGSDAVRQFVLDNVQMWLADYHLDGLRLDAVHAIYDFSARHLLADIQEVASLESQRQGRPLHIIAESDLNDPRLLLPENRGGFNLAAQWSDDFHHAVHSFLTGERNSYYCDFGTAEQLAEAFTEPFLYRGQYSRFRNRRHGAPPSGLAGDRFITSLQNHDQIGNRPGAERLTRLLSQPQLRLAASMLLLSPYLPLVFMGEEYGEEAPFPFFCSFSDAELVEKIRAGRQADFELHGASGTAPDPLAEETYNSAQLTWSWAEGSFSGQIRLLYADLLSARRLWPALRNFDRPRVRLIPSASGGRILELVRQSAADDGKELLALFNLGEEPAAFADADGESTHLEFSSESSRYGGRRIDADSPRTMHPWECLVFSRT
jgi:maltooligosyltrehalose trehalohydrolase